MFQIVELIDHFEDKRIKEKTVEEYNAYLELMGSDIRIRMFLSPEITGIEIGQNIADKIGLCYDGTFCILESEYGDPNDYSIDKLLNYSTTFRKNFEKVKDEIQRICPDIKIEKCIVKIMIILNPIKPLKDISINVDCDNDQYNINVLSPHNIEVDPLLKTIENKIENNEKLTLKDQEVLESAVYARSTKEKHEILLKVSKMVENSNLPEKKKNILNIIFKQQCIRYVKPKYNEETLEVLLMNEKGLMEDYDERRRQEGRLEGLEQGTKQGTKQGIKLGRESAIDTLKEINAPQEIIDKFIEKI